MTATFSAGRIGIVGTGRVARAFALALSAYSARPILVWGRSSRRVDAVLATAPGARATTLGMLAHACDVVAIAVADDALPQVIGNLAGEAAALTGTLAFHVSGGSGVAVLDPLRAAGAHTAAIHPAMTFTGDAPLERQRMNGARFAVTASGPQADAGARRIVGMLGGTVVAVAEEHRALYHASLCHAANHLVTLLSGSFDALRGVGIDDPAALLAPLVRAAMDNTLARGFDALSGPVLRGDARTIAAHVDAMERTCPALLPAYAAMAGATHRELERRRPGHGTAVIDALAAAAPVRDRDGPA